MQRAVNGFLARQKANFLRPPDPRRSLYSLVGGALLAVAGGLIPLLSDWPYSAAAWAVVAGAAMTSIGAAGRLPASHRRLTVMLRATAMALLFLAFVLYILAHQAVGGYTPGDIWSFGFWFIMGGYAVFGFAVPLAAVFGYGLGPRDERPNDRDVGGSHPAAGNTR